jgi:hypothetical protein
MNQKGRLRAAFFFQTEAIVVWFSCDRGLSIRLSKRASGRDARVGASANGGAGPMQAGSCGQVEDEDGSLPFLANPLAKPEKLGLSWLHRVDATAAAQYNPPTLRQAVSFTSRNGVSGVPAKLLRTFHSRLVNRVHRPRLKMLKRCR